MGGGGVNWALFLRSWLICPAANIAISRKRGERMATRIMNMNRLHLLVHSIKKRAPSCLAIVVSPRRVISAFYSAVFLPHEYSARTQTMPIQRLISFPRCRDATAAASRPTAEMISCRCRKLVHNPALAHWLLAGSLWRRDIAT